MSDKPNTTTLPDGWRLFDKYQIRHTDGTPLKGKQYFVLRLDSDDPAEAARVAAAMAAYKGETQMPPPPTIRPREADLARDKDPATIYKGKARKEMRHHDKQPAHPRMELHRRNGHPHRCEEARWRCLGRDTPQQCADPCHHHRARRQMARERSLQGASQQHDELAPEASPH